MRWEVVEKSDVMLAPKLDFLYIFYFISYQWPLQWTLLTYVQIYILATWNVLIDISFFFVVCLLLWMAELVRGSILSTGLSCFIKICILKYFSPRIPHLICSTIVTCECTHIQLIVFFTQLYLYLCMFIIIIVWCAALASCISFRLDLIMRFHFNLSNNILWLYLNGLELNML